MKNFEYTIKSSERQLWMQDVVYIQKQLAKKPDEFHLCIKEDISRDNFESYHIVTLSCIIELSNKSGIKTWLDIENKNLKSYLYNDNRLKKYWTSREIEKYHSPESKAFNLWRIEQEYSYGYAITLGNFFQNVYFKGKELMGLHTCIDELFQNIIDHSQSNGTAFASIEYKEGDNLIDIAICDFGVGIPYTLKSLYKKDEDALFNCLRLGITAKTHTHNKGWGMDNIVNTMSEEDVMHIISNEAVLTKVGGHQPAETKKVPYDFHGTLIYFTISIHDFEDQETLITFTF